MSASLQAQHGDL